MTLRVCFINRIGFFFLFVFGLLVCKDVKRKKTLRRKKSRIVTCTVASTLNQNVSQLCFLGLCSCSPLAEKQEGRGFRLTQHPSFPLAPGPHIHPGIQSWYFSSRWNQAFCTLVCFSLFSFFLFVCFFGSQAVTASFRKLLRQSVCCLFLSKV